MIDRLRTAPVCRLAAAVLALVLSGAPRASLALRPEPEHRCQCSHQKGERCTCPICGARARQARKAALAEVPPCHRALAEQELAAEEERDRHERDAPCVMPSCGGGDPATPPRPSAESFTLPDPPTVGCAGVATPLPALRADPPSGAFAPDPPPPRARA